MIKELWSDEQVRRFAKEIRARYGKHWRFIPDVFHSAIVAEQVLKVTTAASLVCDSVPTKEIARLHGRIYMQLFGDEE